MSEWKPIESAPAPKGYIDEWPSFYSVYEATVLRYACDEGEALCLIRARLVYDDGPAHWEPYAWAELPPPPSPSRDAIKGRGE